MPSKSKNNVSQIPFKDFSSNPNLDKAITKKEYRLLVSAINY